MDIMLTRILELLGDKHGSRKQLADYLGMKNMNRISDWEAGRVKSYRAYASQIADYFGVSMDYLSGKTDEKNKKPATISDDGLSDIQRANVELLKSLTPDEAALARTIMQGIKDARKQ